MQSDQDEFSITMMIAINSTNWISLRQCKNVTNQTNKKVISLELNY